MLNHVTAALQVGGGFGRFEHIDDTVYRGLIKNLALGGTAEIFSGQHLRQMVFHKIVKQLHVAAPDIEKLRETPLQAAIVIYREPPVRVLVEHIIAAASEIQGHAGKIFRRDAVNAYGSPVTVFTHTYPCRCAVQLFENCGRDAIVMGLELI